MPEFLEMSSLTNIIHMLYYNYSIFLVSISGLLAIMTPVMEPMWFMPNERERYVRTFRNANVIFGPSATVFAILLLFWNLVLPPLGIPDYQAVSIIGNVYLYILMVYSLVDDLCTPSISLFLTSNIITTIAFYNTDNTPDNYIITVILLIAFIALCWRLHLSKHSLKQNIQWYMWYAGTFGSTLR
jgi:hypothetical protein